jgi:hypothetical protein
MSRTDVHRPYQVQLADPHNRHLVYRYPMWPWQTGLATYRNLGCGCQRCTGQIERKAQARRARTAGRLACRAYKNTPASERDHTTEPDRILNRRRGW